MTRKHYMIESLEKLHNVKIVYKKDHFLWRMIGFIIKMATFGKNDSFMTRFVTTIGPVIAVPSGFSLMVIPNDRKLRTIHHELVHVKQFKYAGLGSRWLGILPMFIAYVLVLPIGLCPGRWFLEAYAYRTNIAWYQRKYGFQHPETQKQVSRIVNLLAGGAYGWALPPFKFVKRYMRKFLLS